MQENKEELFAFVYKSMLREQMEYIIKKKKLKKKQSKAKQVCGWPRIFEIRAKLVNELDYRKVILMNIYL